MTDNPLWNADRTLVMTGIGPSDDSFSGEFGGRFLTYNVSKARRDCEAGKHGKIWMFEVAPAIAGNRMVEVENDKVERFMRHPVVLMSPLILVIDQGAAWLIDGHHRLRAMDRLGIGSFRGWVIEEDKRGDYLVRFNGKPEMPPTMRNALILGEAFNNDA